MALSLEASILHAVIEENDNLARQKIQTMSAGERKILFRALEATMDLLEEDA